jgi:hypothetical protein
MRSPIAFARQMNARARIFCAVSRLASEFRARKKALFHRMFCNSRDGCTLLRRASMQLHRDA